MKRSSLLHNLCFLLSNHFHLIIKLFLPAFILFSSCRNKIVAPDRIINPPGNVEVYAYNKSITVKFYGNNVEEGFAGYNIYISPRKRIADQHLEPVLNSYGNKPTLLFSSTNCYPDASAKSYVVLTTDSEEKPILNGKSYFIAVSAYLIIGDNKYESDLTEEVKVRVGTKKTIIISNQNIPGRKLDGIIIKNSLIISNIDVPDTPVPYSTGDMYFKYCDISGSLLPVLSTEFNRYGDNGIQDIGYIANIDEYSYIPQGGYVKNGYIPALEKHGYILNIPSKDWYIKIYIINIDNSYIKLYAMEIN